MPLNKITFQEKLLWNLRNNQNSISSRKKFPKKTKKINLVESKYQNINSGSHASTLHSMCAIKPTREMKHTLIAPWEISCEQQHLL